ncbi:hypothetical protein BGZ58_003012, partial [Dissophora ornata]
TKDQINPRPPHLSRHSWPELSISHPQQTPVITPLALVGAICLQTNERFPTIQMDSKQMKNKITNMETRLRFAAERNKAALDSTDKGQLKISWRERMARTCPLSNLDLPHIVGGDIQHEMQDGEASEFVHVDEGVKGLNETARLSVEMGMITRQKELDAKRAKDILDNNIELKKIEMIREEKQHEHERRLAEIQADKDLAVKREELGLQAQLEVMRDMERMRREIDERLTELHQTHLQPRRQPRRHGRSSSKSPSNNIV